MTRYRQPILLCSFALGRGLYCTRPYLHAGDHASEVRP